MLPIETRRREELLAVEISADAHLDPAHMLHQHVARLSAVEMLEAGGNDGFDVPPIFHPPDVIVGGGEAVPVEL